MHCIAIVFLGACALALAAGPVSLKACQRQCAQELVQNSLKIFEFCSNKCGMSDSFQENARCIRNCMEGNGKMLLTAHEMCMDRCDESNPSLQRVLEWLQSEGEKSGSIRRSSQRSSTSQRTESTYSEDTPSEDSEVVENVYNMLNEDVGGRVKRQLYDEPKERAKKLKKVKPLAEYRQEDEVPQPQPPRRLLRRGEDGCTLVERGATRSTKTTRQSSSVDQSFQTSDEELELPDDDEEGYGLTEEEVLASKKAKHASKKGKAKKTKKTLE